LSTSPSIALLRWTALLAVPVFATGCASIINGTTQTIAVDSTPQGANVELHCMSGTVTGGRTPTSVSVKRKETSCAVTFSKEGFHPATVRLERELSGWYFGNILVGGVVGFIVDAADGAMFTQSPGEVRATLMAVPSASVAAVAAAQPPKPVADRRRMLKSREGKVVAWIADDQAALDSCTDIAHVDPKRRGTAEIALVADEVEKVGGDTVFNPQGTVVYIYKCGALARLGDAR
jgi:hypothetical protein